MSSDGEVIVEHVWKRFRRGEAGRSLRERVAALAGHGEWRWALRDVSFAVEPGQAVGIVGVNGSGKSTLLKILTRVMDPYAGCISVGGSVGALIEIHAGMHPDLTGAENVYLYGALMGLPRRLVAARFEEIIAFAELEDAVDRQLKFYSSGMKMRLGFAVAALMDPSVLIVDEVLAVGDANFQRKCLAWMSQTIERGTTVILVSHDLVAVENVCSRAIWIHDGRVAEDGSVSAALTGYRRAIEELARGEATPSPVTFVTGGAYGEDGGPVRSHGDLHVAMTLRAVEPTACEVHVGVSQGTAIPIFTIHRTTHLEAGDNLLRAVCRRLPLAAGRYSAWMAATRPDGSVCMPWSPVMDMDVEGPGLHRVLGGVGRLAPIRVESDWDV